MAVPIQESRASEINFYQEPTAQKQVIPSNSVAKKITDLTSFCGGGYIGMNQRFLHPRKIDKTIFKSDNTIQKDYNGLVKSNKKLKKNF